MSHRNKCSVAKSRPLAPSSVACHSSVPVAAADPIAARLRELMSEKKVSIRRLAATMCELEGGSRDSRERSIKRWRKGEVIPDRANVQVLAAALDVDPAEFLPAGVTQADWERLTLEVEEREAKIRHALAERDDAIRKLAERSAADRQPRELPKPGSRTLRNG